MTWTRRLKRVFGIDIATCPASGGAVRIIACIEDPDVFDTRNRRCCLHGLHSRYAPCLAQKKPRDYRHGALREERSGVFGPSGDDYDGRTHRWMQLTVISVSTRFIEGMTESVTCPELR